MAVCPNCGKEVSDDVSFCPNCGERLKKFTAEERQKYIRELDASAKEKPVNQRRLTGKQLAGIIAVCIIAAVAVVVATRPMESTPLPQTYAPVVFSGSSDTTTQPFAVTTREWIIDWSYVPDPEHDGVFAFWVYPRGETAMFVEWMIADGDTFGTTYSYAGKGEYYIKVLCLFVEQWEITVRPA